ncbi:MAG: nucleotidyltransferase family protein [Polyangia bacterium]
MTRTPAVGPVALVLAAGASTRMGTGAAKALIELGGVRMLDRVLSSLEAVGVEPLVVIGPPHGAAIRAALPASVRTAWNPRPERGMLSSVQTGLGELVAAPVMGALIWPVDVPLVQAVTVRRLLQAAQAEGAGRPVLPTHAGRGGHPLWLPACRFADVLALPEGATLRELRARHPELRLEVTDAAVLRDLDTPADLAAARASVPR